jgi:hypothetical protein
MADLLDLSGITDDGEIDSDMIETITVTNKSTGAQSQIPAIIIYSSSGDRSYKLYLNSRGSYNSYLKENSQRTPFLNISREQAIKNLKDFRKSENNNVCSKTALEEFKNHYN